MSEAPCTLCGTKPEDVNRAVLGSAGCPRCGATIPYEVRTKGNRIILDGKVADWGRGPEYHSHVAWFESDGQFHALITRMWKGDEYGGYRGRASTATGAARKAVEALAEWSNCAWWWTSPQLQRELRAVRREEGYED